MSGTPVQDLSMVPASAASAVVPAVPRPVALTAKDVVRNVDLVRQVARSVMKEGVHYGVIPGSDKPSLRQAGAQTLQMTFRLRQEFKIVQSTRTPALVDYLVECTLVHIPTNEVISSCIASCNSKEEKYRWKALQRLCPECEQATIKRSKFADQGSSERGWYCHAKAGGCGAQFAPNDPAIVGQKTGRVENDNALDMDNTILKMAEIRASRGATLNGTAASDVFTQDAEGDDETENGGAKTERSDRSDLWGDHESQEPQREQPRPAPAPKPAPVGETLPPAQYVENATLALKALWDVAARIGTEPHAALVAAWGKGMNTENANKVIAHLSSLSHRKVPADSYKTPDFYERAAKLAAAFALLPDAEARAKVKGGDAFAGGVQ